MFACAGVRVGGWVGVHLGVVFLPLLFASATSAISSVVHAASTPGLQVIEFIGRQKENAGRVIVVLMLGCECDDSLFRVYALCIVANCDTLPHLGSFTESVQ